MIDTARQTGVESQRSHLPFIMALAVIARVVFATFVLRAGLSERATSITSWNYEDVFIAQSLLSGAGYSSPFHFPSGPTALLSPGYPLLIAAVLRFTGNGRAAVVALIGFQIFLSILIIPLIMWMARRYFGTRTANLAGLIYAISEPMLLLPLYIWDTCLSALLLTAAVALTCCPRWKAKWYSLVAGIICAVGTLVNPTLFLSLIAVFAWSAWRARIVPWLAVLTFLVAFSPWPIRNLRVMHSFIPFRSTINYELWEGNRVGGDGNVPKHASPLANPQERELFLAYGEVGYMRSKGVLARGYIATHKIEFAKLTMKRIVRFWTGSSESPGPLTGTLSLLALSGLALAWRRRRILATLLLPIAIYPLPFYITHPNARYQFVIDPLLAILAGFACESFFAWCARRPAPSPTIVASTH
jgi:uncharacterized membrane protein YtjA (UPF0391 family)